MTQASIPIPLPLESNEAYLNWEMERLKERLTAYLKAKESPEAVEVYYRLVEDLSASRLSLIEARKQAVSAGVEIPFHQLVERYGLSPKDEDALMVCLAPHLSSVNWHLLVCCQGSVLKNYLEVGFVAELISTPNQLLTQREWCEPEAALTRNGLLFLSAPDENSTPVSLLTHAVYAPHYVAAAVGGMSTVDERLSSFCEIKTPEKALFELILHEETRGQVESFIRGFYRREGLQKTERNAWSILVSGPRQSGKSMLAEAVAKSFGCPLFVIHLGRLGRRNEDMNLFRLAIKNAAFLNAVVLFNQPEQLLTHHPSALGSVISLIADYPGVAVIEPHDISALPQQFEPLIDFPIEIERADTPLREQLWEALIPPQVSLDKKVNIAALASKYGLTGGQVKAAVEWALQRSGTRKSKRLTQNDLEAGAISQLRSKLTAYADASRVSLTLDDLVLAEEPKRLIEEFLDACRSRQKLMNDWGFGNRLATGKGLVTLFSGEAGTGKTLCAEILANELDLRLHIVSIPKVVSKWVGETEKNIRDIFSHARSQNSMLLFDEADSLFTTRVKVEKSQDHFQNMEVNMLLQEIERFEGIVVLTTNLETNIDRAFQRRILFKVEFPVPGVEERAAIWRILIPAEVPLAEDLDYTYLAEAFELTGGQIKNAIVRGAYRACARGDELDQETLEDSARQQAKEAGILTRSY